MSQPHLESNSLSIFRLLSACHVPATALGTVPRLSPSSISPLRSVLFTPIVLSCIFRNIREFPRGDMAHEHPVLAPEGLTVQWWGWGGREVTWSSTARADVRGISRLQGGGWGTERKEQGTLLEGGKPREEDISWGLHRGGGICIPTVSESFPCC